MKQLLERYHLSHTGSISYKWLIVLGISFAFSLGTNAQTISSHVFNGWGSSLYFNNNTYDGSAGEVGITTLRSDNYIITQGFLQPIDLKVPCGEVELRAFPNPVVLGMRIYAEGCDVEISKVEAYDLFGKVVYEGKPLSNEVDFSSIGVGVYMIRAFDAEEKMLGIVKIIKTTI